MADGIRILRVAAADHAARGVGLRTDQPTVTSANQKARGKQSDVYAMPTDAVAWQPLQVLDVGSADFGKFLFLPDYSTPGGPDIIL